MKYTIREKVTYVAFLAGRLAHKHRTMTRAQLAEELNMKGITTQYGTEYVGGRGTARLVARVAQILEADGEYGAAETVALAFTNTDGSYPFKVSK